MGLVNSNEAQTTESSQILSKHASLLITKFQAMKENRLHLIIVNNHHPNPAASTVVKGWLGK